MFVYFGIVRIVIVNYKKTSKEIMSNPIFQNWPQIKVTDALFYGCTDVAFFPYGEYWREMKKICVLKLLSLKRVQAFQYVRAKEVEEMIENVSQCCSKDGGLIDLS